MRLLKRSSHVFLSTEYIDMRKSINGLASIVENDFNLDLYEDAMFVFMNKGRDKVKILYWDHIGFCLYYKRLEKGHFAWPKNFRGGRVNEIPEADLKRLIAGVMMESYIERPNYRLT